MNFPELKIVSKKPRITTFKDIQKVGRKIGLTMPDDFKVFLLEYQGEVSLDINHVIVNYGKKIFDEIAVFRISDIDDIFKSWNNIKDYEDCKGILAFGDTIGGGRFWGLSLNAEDYGSVYLFEAHLERKEHELNRFRI